MVTNKKPLSLGERIKLEIKENHKNGGLKKSLVEGQIKGVVKLIDSIIDDVEDRIKEEITETERKKIEQIELYLDRFEDEKYEEELRKFENKYNLMIEKLENIGIIMTKKEKGYSPEQKLKYHKKEVLKLEKDIMDFLEKSKKSLDSLNKNYSDFIKKVLHTQAEFIKIIQNKKKELAIPKDFKLKKD